MALFPNNWNGTGGEAFSERAINMFRTVINTLVKQPEIAPTGRNSLYMQYNLEDGTTLAFELREDTAEKVYLPNGNFDLADIEIFDNDVAENINKCVENFYGHKHN